MPFRMFNPCGPCCCCWPPTIPQYGPDNKRDGVDDYSPGLIAPTILAAATNWYCVFNGVPFTATKSGDYYYGSVDVLPGGAYTFTDVDLINCPEVEPSQGMDEFYNTAVYPTNTTPITLPLRMRIASGIFYAEAQLDSGWVQIAQSSYGYSWYSPITLKVEYIGAIGQIVVYKLIGSARFVDFDDTIGGYAIVSDSQLVVSSVPFDYGTRLSYRHCKCMRNKVNIRLTEVIDGNGTKYLDGYETVGYGVYNNTIHTGASPGFVGDGLTQYDGPADSLMNPIIGGLAVSYYFSISTDDVYGYGYITLNDTPTGTRMGFSYYPNAFVGRSYVKLWRKDRVLGIWRFGLNELLVGPYGPQYSWNSGVYMTYPPTGIPYFLEYEENFSLGMYDDIGGFHTRLCDTAEYSDDANNGTITSPTATGYVRGNAVGGIVDFVVVYDAVNRLNFEITLP